MSWVLYFGLAFHWKMPRFHGVGHYENNLQCMTQHFIQAFFQTLGTHSLTSHTWHTLTPMKYVQIHPTQIPLLWCFCESSCLLWDLIGCRMLWWQKETPTCRWLCLHVAFHNTSSALYSRARFFHNFWSSPSISVCVCVDPFVWIGFVLHIPKLVCVSSLHSYAAVQQ